MKLFSVYLQELQNVILGVMPFIISHFFEKPLVNQEIEDKIKKPEDKKLFYETIEDLKNNKEKEKETIVLSSGESLTIIVK